MYPSREMIKIFLKFWIRKKKVKEYIEKKRFFFILSVGRSGSKFLSVLLNKAPEVYVAHEPVISDFRALNEAYYDSDEAYKYINHFRMKEIYNRTRNIKFTTYGEVNGVLRRHDKALKKLFSNVILIHLIRDGRDVVRSLIPRTIFTDTERNPGRTRIFKNELGAKWAHIGRFEKLCWYWKIENEYLNENIEKTIMFEKLLSDYEYFKTEILDLLDLKISKKIWLESINKPQNITKKHTFDHWTKWNEDYKIKFEQICGELMRKNGYQL
ncbi:MAG: sulfotransferase [Promethearchaeota archaeon]